MIFAAEKKFWILDPLYNSLGALLSWFYALIPSYGVAIILLTVAVRILIFPLTAKQVKAQQAMQRLQPEMKRLQAKHKGDRVKLNEEMMNLYKEHKVNPLASCLPLILQMPLFIVLYRLILDLSAKGGPKHIPTDSALFESLVESGGKMVSFGMDLSERATSVNGIGKAIPFYVLIAIVMATGYYQQRQITARTPKDSPPNPQMQMMAKVFPAIFGFISLSIPAGVVVYFAASNLWQIGQQALAFRNKPAPGGVIEGTAVEKDRNGDSKDGTPSAKDKAAKDKAAAKGKSTTDKPRAPITSKRVTPKKSSRSGGKGRRPPASPRPKGLRKPPKKD